MHPQDHELWQELYAIERQSDFQGVPSEVLAADCTAMLADPFVQLHGLIDDRITDRDRSRENRLEIHRVLCELGWRPPARTAVRVVAQPWGF
jgi:hypothetical protein